MRPARPAVRSLTVLIAVGGTAVGVLALYFLQDRLAPVLSGGPGAICTEPDCALGVGVWLMAGAFVATVAALIASVVVAARGRPSSARRAARLGLLVCLWCLLAYAVESTVLWILA